jgi:hypothetical protein
MHKNVEVLIGRLATDPELQRRFAEQPIAVLHEQRLELTEVEIAALAALDPDDLRAFTAALDLRLRKASRRAMETLTAESRRHSDPEISR